MKLPIKTKLVLGLTFLFCIILLTGTIGGFIIYRISHESGEILSDNKESIQYAESMLRVLDEKTNDASAFSAAFGPLLSAQEKNITEPGEKELTDAIRRAYENDTGAQQVASIRRSLHALVDLNLQAIERKSDATQTSAKNAVSFLVLIATFCLLIALTFIVNFPGYIANPIRQLTNSIKAIANKNYAERIHFASNDEFGELAEAFNRMAQKLDEYEHLNLSGILFEKKRIGTIIDNMRDGIIGLDEKQVVLFANPVACRLLELREKEVSGKTAAEIAATNTLMRLLLEAIDAGETKKEGRPLRFTAGEKETYYSPELLKVYSPATTDKAPAFIGHVIVLKNVTEFRELDAAKTNFIATISHELKTPISSIGMSARLLEDTRIGGMNEEQQKLVGNIKEETQRLLKITGELLDLAQVETGKIQLSLRSVRPVEIIGYATDALKFQATQRNVRVEVHCPADLPRVNADLEKTAWVMVNLLSNAIRYSPENGVVTIRAFTAGDRVRFSVRDKGMGIDAQYRERIFEKFFQVPGSQKTGTGLGLAISKEFIESQDGKIWVESGEGQGTEFSFTLVAAK